MNSFFARFAIAIALAVPIALALLAIAIAVELRADANIDTFWEANGPEYHVIDRGAYDRAVREGICRAASHVHAFPDQHETQHVCEL